VAVVEAMPKESQGAGCLETHVSKTPKRGAPSLIAVHTYAGIALVTFSLSIIKPHEAGCCGNPRFENRETWGTPAQPSWLVGETFLSMRRSGISHMRATST
jgi:hypothetical protein